MTFIQEKIFSEPLPHARHNFKNRGDTEVGEKEKDENPCIKKSHSNEEIQDFGFIYCLILKTVFCPV